jgi:hypothetical protein
MDASTISTVIAGASAAIAAFSAWNSSRSAQASLAALKESREQRAVDNSRASLAAIGDVYDHSMALVQSLDRDLTRDPPAVARKREALRRSALVAGVLTPSVQKLLDATAPLPPSQITRLREELMSTSAALREEERRAPQGKAVGDAPAQD